MADERLRAQFNDIKVDNIQIKNGITFTSGTTSRTAMQTFVANVTLTTAQILALNGTPVTVLAAPGAGKAIIIKGVTAIKPAGTAYAGIDVNEDIVLRYTNASGAVVTAIETTGFLDQATAQVRYAHPSSWTTNAPSALLNFTPVANAAIVAHMTTAEIITGTSDVTLRIEYVVVDTV